MGQKGEKFVDANDRDWLGLHDRVCVITGAASGIGRETAIQFATVGAKVVAIDGASGIEVAVLGPAHAAERELKRLAVTKLRARIARQGDRSA